MPLSRALRRGEGMTSVPSTSVAVVVGRLHGLPAIIRADVPESARPRGTPTSRPHHAAGESFFAAAGNLRRDGAMKVAKALGGGVDGRVQLRVHRTGEPS